MKRKYMMLIVLFLLVPCGVKADLCEVKQANTKYKFCLRTDAKSCFETETDFPDNLADYNITDVYLKTEVDNKFIEKPTSEKTLADYNITNAATSEDITNAVGELNTSISQAYALKNDLISINTRVETLESNDATTNSSIENINNTLNALPTSYYTEADAEQTFLKKTDSYTKNEINTLLANLKTEILKTINLPTLPTLPTLSGKYTLIVSGEDESLVYDWEKVQDPSTGEETV